MNGKTLCTFKKTIVIVIVTSPKGQYPHISGNYMDWNNCFPFKGHNSRLM